MSGYWSKNWRRANVRANADTVKSLMRFYMQGSAEPSIKFRKLIFACLCRAFAPGSPFASCPWKQQHYWKQREDYLFEMCRWCLWERGACVFEFQREMRHLFHKLELGSWEEMFQFGYVQQDTVEMNWHILLACALLWSKMFHSNVREIERVKPCSTSRSKRDRNGSEHLPFVLTFAYMFRATFHFWKELQQRTTQKGEEILHRESHICKQAKNIKNKVQARLWVCLFEEKHSIHCLINMFLIFPF